MSVRNGRAAPRRGRGRGFTLIELMVTIAVAGVLTALAGPSLSRMFKANRVQTEASAFVGDLMMARTEAIKRGQSVSVCVSSDGTNCATTNTWQSGWIVLADPTAACSAVSATTPLLHRGKTFSGTDTFVASSSTATCVTFNREGFTSNLGTASVTFTLHTTPTVTDATRCVVVDLGGRINTRKAGEVASCS